MHAYFGASVPRGNAENTSLLLLHPPVFVYISTTRGREEVHALSTYSTRILDKTANSECHVPEIKRHRITHIYIALVTRKKCMEHSV